MAEPHSAPNGNLLRHGGPIRPFDCHRDSKPAVPRGTESQQGSSLEGHRRGRLRVLVGRSVAWYRPALGQEVEGESSRPPLSFIVGRAADTMAAQGCHGFERGDLPMTRARALTPAAQGRFAMRAWRSSRCYRNIRRVYSSSPGISVRQTSVLRGITRACLAVGLGLWPLPCGLRRCPQDEPSIENVKPLSPSAYMRRLIMWTQRTEPRVVSSMERARKPPEGAEPGEIAVTVSPARVKSCDNTTRLIDSRSRRRAAR